MQSFSCLLTSVRCDGLFHDDSLAYGSGQFQPRERQPKWLTELLIAMRSKENMTAGLAAMRSLSGKSHEHLCRALRRYTGQSPSAYISRLRLSYAANLLVNSDLPILTVMLESGFDNASHFNRCFKTCYACTPRQFRNSRQNSLF